MSSRTVLRQRGSPGQHNLAELHPRPYSLNVPDQPVSEMSCLRTPSNHPRPHSVPPPTTASGGPGTLAVTLPTVNLLESVMVSRLESFSDMDKLHWAQEVVRLLDRYLKVTRTTTCPPHFRTIIRAAIPIIVSFTTHRSSTIVGLSSYLKAHLLGCGACPEDLPKDSRQAFKEFEIAARAGEIRAWFRLGRDYETCGEEDSAKACFERGASKGDGECQFRMGMALLMGQLGVPPSPTKAIALLRRAASLSTIDAPQAAYVFGMLLAGEFEQVSVPSNILLPPTTGPCPEIEAQHSEARSLILRAAYFCFAPAQYKAGYLYEHAQLGCGYEPLLSVQYYSLASQNGELEADMALSKWFLVGAEGSFEKNETLARTFAQKAAKARLPSGCFALGYYYELGIGGNAESEKAMIWYKQGAELGSNEAADRLRALESSNPIKISAQDHLATVYSTVVRKRTDAKMRSERIRPGAKRQQDGNEKMRTEAHKQAQRASMMTMQPMGFGDAQSGPSTRFGRLGNTSSGMDSPPQPYIPGGYPASPFPGGMANHSSSAPHSPGQLTEYREGFTPPLKPGSAATEQSRPTLPRRGAIAHGGIRGRKGSDVSSPLLLPRSSQAHLEDLQLDDSPRQSYSLQDKGPVERQRTPRPPAGGARQDLGAATFAEMGFVSKPVKDDDCKVM